MDLIKVKENQVFAFGKIYDVFSIDSFSKGPGEYAVEVYDSKDKLLGHADVTTSPPSIVGLTTYGTNVTFDTKIHYTRTVFVVQEYDSLTIEVGSSKIVSILSKLGINITTKVTIKLYKK